MRVSVFTTMRPNASATRTYESFTKFLGAKAERMGIMAKLYEDCTLTSLTEGLMNIVYKDAGKDKNLRSINSFLVEWGIQSTKIERITMVKDAEGDGCNKSEVKFYFDKAWYNINDVFVVEKTHQQFIVVAQPVRISDKCHLVIAKIQDIDYNSMVSEAVEGMTTRYVSNVQPELHKPHALVELVTGVKTQSKFS